MNWMIDSTVKYRMDEWESKCSRNDVHVAGAGTGAAAGARMSDGLIGCLAHQSSTTQHTTAQRNLTSRVVLERVALSLVFFANAVFSK
jgi:hypothetical protein